MPRLLLLPLLLAWLAASPALAAKAPPKGPTDEDCLTCHSDPDAKRADGRPVFVKVEAWKASVHGQAGLSCTDCHASLAKAELPHDDKVAPVDCATCHEDAVKLYKASVHARPGKDGRPNAVCGGCHGLHDILGSKDPASRTRHLEVAKMCETCHGKSRAGRTFDDSIHGQALIKKGLVVAPNCATCHGHHDILPPSEAESKVARAKVPALCGSCHTGIDQIYEQSIHGQQLKAGNPRAPVCTSCHSTHGIAATGRAWQVEVAKECGTCHTTSAATYRDTFHGKVRELGFTRGAVCADCHGSHDIQPEKDPRSRVSAARRVETCQRCHQGVNANFAAYDPHADPDLPDRNPMLHYTSRFMKLLLGGVFAFFGTHTLLWLPREVRARRAARKGGHA
jgi:hypothetical protein